MLESIGTDISKVFHQHVLRPRVDTKVYYMRAGKNVMLVMLEGSNNIYTAVKSSDDKFDTATGIAVATLRAQAGWDNGKHIIPNMKRDWRIATFDSNALSAMGMVMQTLGHSDAKWKWLEWASKFLVEFIKLDEQNF